MFSIGSTVGHAINKTVFLIRGFTFLTKFVSSFSLIAAYDWSNWF